MVPHRDLLSYTEQRVKKIKTKKDLGAIQARAWAQIPNGGATGTGITGTGTGMRMAHGHDVDDGDMGHGTTT